MKVFLIGSGGREHALAWKFHGDGHDVWAAPGNVGTAQCGTNIPISVEDIPGLIEEAEKLRPDLVVVGPEAPLVEGLADELRSRGIATFGPGKKGAQLEGSKGFSKDFFRRGNIPTAEYFVCDDMSSARKAIEHIGDDVVVKVDGLAGGKGVLVCRSLAEAIDFAEVKFSQGISTVVVEEKLVGRELSVLAITDGTHLEILQSAEDHKAIYDGDEGPNTGGMGTVSPGSWVTEELLERVKSDILQPTLDQLAQEKIDYRGVLYAGLMVSPEGEIRILEYNCRFGDPEIQSLVLRMENDLAEVLLQAAQGNLREKSALKWKEDVGICVVLASKGYPQTSTKGCVIEGAVNAESRGATLFTAGVALEGDSWVTAGGRVLNVCLLAPTVLEARRRVYSCVEKISFDGMQFRQDIGARNELAGGDKP